MQRNSGDFDLADSSDTAIHSKSLQKRLEETNVKYNTLIRNNRRYESKAHFLELECDRLYDRINTKDKFIKEKDVRIRDLEIKLMEAKTDLEVLRFENNKSKSSNLTEEKECELRNNLQKTIQINLELNEKVINMQSGIKYLKNEFEKELKVKEDSKLDEIKKLKEDHTTSIETIKIEAKQKETSLSKEINHLKASITDIEKKLEELRNTCETRDKERASKRNEYNKLVYLYHKNKKTNLELNEKVKNFQETLHSEKSKLENKLAEKQQELEKEIEINEKIERELEFHQKLEIVLNKEKSELKTKLDENEVKLKGIELKCLKFETISKEHEKNVNKFKQDLENSINQCQNLEKMNQELKKSCKNNQETEIANLKEKNDFLEKNIELCKKAEIKQTEETKCLENKLKNYENEIALLKDQISSGERDHRKKMKSLLEFNENQHLKRKKIDQILNKKRKLFEQSLFKKKK